MAEQLRKHFERAVGDDPHVPAVEVARAAIAEGSRLRRRRHRLTAAGVAAAVVTVAGAVTVLNLPAGAPQRAEPPMTVAAAMMPVSAPSCTGQLVEHRATDVVVFLHTEASDRQRTAVGTALEADPVVETVLHESRSEAYERFRVLWADSPDFLAAVTPDQLPESFRLRLVTPERYPALRSRYAAMDGVADVIGRQCPQDAPVGGVL